MDYKTARKALSLLHWSKRFEQHSWKKQQGCGHWVGNEVCEGQEAEQIVTVRHN